jgi:single-strand DNA-binding protein
MNEVTIVGNVTSNPVYHVSEGNQHRVARFDLAVSRETAEQDDVPPVIHRVEAVGRLADNVTESLQRGLEVVVIGKFVDDSYQIEDRREPRQLLLEAEVVAPSLRFAPAAVKCEGRRPGAPKREQNPEVYDGE